MGWAIGDDKGRDIGYGVPAYCDHPDCHKTINRGLSFVCGGEPYGGDEGCGLFFCDEHLYFADHNTHQVCAMCLIDYPAFGLKPDHPTWIAHKMRHSSWALWRLANPDWVKEHE